MNKAKGEAVAVKKTKFDTCYYKLTRITGLAGLIAMFYIHEINERPIDEMTYVWVFVCAGFSGMSYEIAQRVLKPRA